MALLSPLQDRAPPRSSNDKLSVPRAGSTETCDEQLVERALGGDRWAEDALFRRHVGPVTGTVVRLLGDRTEAEDIVQDTFATALDGLSTLREPAAFQGWLLRIAVSKVHRLFRRRRLLRRLGFGADEEGGLSALAAPGAGPEAGAELYLLDVQLRRLPTPERIAWLLRHVEGLPLAEVAHACDCSLATAKRRIDAAHTRIRSHVRIGEVDHG